MATSTINEQQSPLPSLDAARIKFSGMAIDEIGNPPEIDDEMTFVVTAVCTGRGVQRMKDGELRRTATMQVLDLDVKEGPTRPTGEPSLFSDGDGDDDSEDDSDD